MQTDSTRIVPHEVLNYGDMVRPCDCGRPDCPENRKDNLLRLVLKDSDYPAPGTFAYKMLNME